MEVGAPSGEAVICARVRLFNTDAVFGFTHAPVSKPTLVHQASLGWDCYFGSVTLSPGDSMFVYITLGNINAGPLLSKSLFDSLKLKEEMESSTYFL